MKLSAKLLIGFGLLLLGASVFSHFSKKTIAYVDRNIVYQDSLSAGWDNWSWNTSVNLQDTQTAAGSYSMSFTSSPWGGLYLHSQNPIYTHDITHLQFTFKPANSEQKYRIYLVDNNNAFIDNQIDWFSQPAEQLKDGWRRYTISLTDLKAEGKVLSGIMIQEASGVDQVKTQIDDVKFVADVNKSNSVTSSPSAAIFTDFLNEGWFNWSWGGNVSVTNEIQFSHEPWAGLYLRSEQPLDISGYTHINMSIRSNKANLPYKIALFDSQSQLVSFVEIRSFGTEVTTDWQTISVPLSSINGGKTSIQGLVLHDGSGENAILYVDSIMFVNNGSVATPTTAPTPKPIVEATLTSQEPSVKKLSQATVSGSGYSVAGKKVYRNGSPIQLRGVNWFGFETETYAPHGLWLRNWKEMIQQMKQAGFNSVRVPFCPTTLAGTVPVGIDYSLNPDLRGLTSLEVLDQVVTELNNQQMYVLLDHHRPDCQAISQLWYTHSYSEDKWISDLTFIANRYKNREYLMGIDLKNEPHGAATWGTGNVATDWNIAAEKAGKAVLAVNPNILVFVEGVQENSTCSSTIGHWMGGNIEPINCSPINTSSIPANKLVLSPHVYGPDVYNQGYFNDGNFPHNMTEIWNTHFGNVSDAGYTVVPGEWGGKYGEGDPKDVTWQKAMAAYFTQKGICNSYYWSWNPNSGDTGGILRDDWKTLRSDKLELINNYFNSCK